MILLIHPEKWFVPNTILLKMGAYPGHVFVTDPDQNCERTVSTKCRTGSRNLCLSVYW